MVSSVIWVYHHVAKGNERHWKKTLMFGVGQSMGPIGPGQEDVASSWSGGFKGGV